ncbi:MAG: hypothetical protein IPJ19_02280 [Planctomycetes bacterium]|nr:hypothetical protein [Planctomycetota bacterium]
MPDLYPTVRLDTDELPAGPWIFGRNVGPLASPPEDGSLVEVEDRSGRFVGHALFNSRSDIRMRLVSRGKKSELRNPREFLLRRLAAADRLRKKTLRIPEQSDAYRIAHAEGDDLPGLVVDRLGSAIVCEYHALGFWRLREEIASALSELYPGFPIYHRVPKSARASEGFEPRGEEEASEELWITENGLRYPVLPAQGHKTGWFCDQRENRALVASYASGADVLDLCCNLGGFALHAARGCTPRARGGPRRGRARACAARRAGEQTRRRFHPCRRLRLPARTEERFRAALAGRARSAQADRRQDAVRGRDAALPRHEHARDRLCPAGRSTGDLLVLGRARPAGLHGHGLPLGPPRRARDSPPGRARSRSGPPPATRFRPLALPEGRPGLRRLSAFERKSVRESTGSSVADPPF